jgi:hypothetical protein
VLHSNFGCCRGTTKKSATYKIAGAVERRAVPIGELVENKARRLKEKNHTAAHRAPFPQQQTPFTLFARAASSGRGPLARLPMVAPDCGIGPAPSGGGLRALKRRRARANDRPGFRLSLLGWRCDAPLESPLLLVGVLHARLQPLRGLTQRGDPWPMRDIDKDYEADI